MLFSRVLCSSASACSLVLLLGCGDLEPLLVPSGCPAWTTADASGVCQERAWVLPSASEGLGPAGARAVSLAIDGRAKAFLGWEIATLTMSGIVAAEEQEPGAFSTRSPSLDVVSSGVIAKATATRVAAGLDGTAVVTWGQLGASNGEAIFASYRDAAGRWTDPHALEDALSFAPRAYQPDVATSRSGEWILAWDQWYAQNYGVAIATRGPGGAEWKRPKSGDDVLSPPIFYANAPQIAVNGAGSALVVWYQSTGGPLMVYASERASKEGAFSRPGIDDTLSAPGAPVDSHTFANPRPAIAESGEAAVVWTQENGQGAIPVFLATRDREGVWTRPKDLADSFSPALGSARSPKLAFGPGGELYVVWHQDQGDGDAVYAARRDASNHWVEDGKHPTRLSAPAALGHTPSLAVGPGGGVLAVFTEDSNGHLRIVARRTGAGDTPWSAQEALSPEGDAAEDPVAAIGPGDRAIAAWTQGPFGGARVYTARLE